MLIWDLMNFLTGVKRQLTLSLQMKKDKVVKISKHISRHWHKPNNYNTHLRRFEVTAEMRAEFPGFFENKTKPTQTDLGFGHPFLHFGQKNNR